jgi:transcriptional regulator with XRE-family HTH domain
LSPIYKSYTIEGKKCGEVACLAIQGTEKTVESIALYWGEEGRYGPFSAQDDGWPNAGEVVRYYRKAANMTLANFARQYGVATKTVVTSQWIYRMEKQNKVPTDITRRQAIVNILQIPPILLGLGTLETISRGTIAETEKLPITPAILKPGIAINLSNYEREIRTFYLLTYTSNAHHALGDIQAAISELEEIEQQSGGELQRTVRELLFSYYRLAKEVYQDIMDLPVSYRFANLSVRTAKNLGRKDLIAGALYGRGYSSKKHSEI